MMDIDKKIKSIENSCFELAEKDAKELEDKIEKISEDKVNQKVDDYKEELLSKYEKEKNKILREYNQKVFEYEKNQKIKINKFKESLLNNIKNKVKNELILFTNSYEYEEFLYKRIENTLKKIKDNEKQTKIFVVEKDFYKFENKISQKFNLQVEKIDNSNIGGCIIENYNQKILLDNTFKTNIEEEIIKIDF